MRALVAGTGDLPAVLARHDPDLIICAMAGFDPAIPVDLRFRIETLGQFLDDLVGRDVTQVCFAGAVNRPDIDPSAIDAKTVPLVPRLLAAISKGDDGALRDVLAIFEERGFAIIAAHDIAPTLLPPSGVLSTRDIRKGISKDARLGQSVVAAMGERDQGQACVIRDGQVLVQEQRDGTDAMLRTPDIQGGILFKAPKPNQDRRADLPTIGPGTVQAASAAGLRAIVIEHDGVMVLDQAAVIEAADGAGICLWVKAKEAD